MLNFYFIYLSIYFWVSKKQKTKKTTLSHGNSYIFYEVANSYEFVRLHSYDLVRFV